MAVPIALYTSPCTSVCSTPYPCQINAHGTYDFELNSRSSSTGTSSASNSQKTTLGGLSCLFSASSVKQASFSGDREDLGSVWRDKGENLKEFSCSFRFSPTNYLCGGTMKRDQSPVSVLQCPFSCSSSSPIRIARDWVSGDASGSLRGEVNGLSKGIVRNALGSSAFYDSTSVDVDRDGLDTVVGASSGLDELTFNMDDGSVEANHAPYAEELLASAKLRHKIFSEDLVVKAFYEAERAHRGQLRASGDPYLQHCVETAVLLATIGASSTVVAAGLLHDTIDDSFLNYDYIRNLFAAEVADLVRGVSKLSQLSKLARQNNTASKTVEADRLHTMFLAMTDARAVLIKLADRLHNMMTLDALPLVKQQRFAKETLEIFAPIANRLGIFSWKEKLENLCFKYLYSDQHRYMSSKLVETFDEEMITSASEKLERAFKAEAISYHLLSGRHKSLYSIYCKMAKKKLRMDEIHDIHGLRVIVENEEDCYKALRVVQQLWSEVPGKFKDYISRPKYNGYQSLHTVVIGEGRVPLEVQIRTKEMHLQAEIGIAAHWRYKEDDSKHSSFVLKMVEWARWVITWHCEALKKNCSLIECVDSVKPPCSFSSLVGDSPFSYKSDHGQDGPVFVILIDNDKMSVQEFPANSTVNDLLERMGSQSPRLTFYGSPVIEELRARVNHEPIDDTKFKVKMGDVVEVTATVPDKSLTEYREEIQRIYNHGSTAASSTSATATGMTACRS